jgi:hypothetical protein
MSNSVVRGILGLVGGVAGGAIGYFITAWLADRGLYALVIPGALLGAGCGWLAGTRSKARGLLCGVAGLALGVYTNWRLTPFIDDKSFSYFLKNIHQENPMFLLMVALGTLAAYWFGRDTVGNPRPVGKPRSDGPTGTAD